MQYLDKKGLYLIMERVVCLNRGREPCLCVCKERKEVGRGRKEPAGLNSHPPTPHPHHVVLIRVAFPSPEHPNKPVRVLGKDQNSHGLVLEISGELWGKVSALIPANA